MAFLKPELDILSLTATAFPQSVRSVWIVIPERK
jgi:hypothetical protein